MKIEYSEFVSIVRTDTCNEAKELKDMISDAFPTDVSLSHGECEDLRTSMVSIHNEDVKRLLGPVLIDLIETHRTSMEGSPDWADSIVRYLSSANPAPLRHEPYLRIDTKAMAENADSRKVGADAFFSKFSFEQSRAILCWLDAAISWEESNIPTDELTAALEYWRRRLVALKASGKGVKP